MSENDITFEACEKDIEQAKLIMNWRNDPVTLKMFYHHTPKIWPDFWEEYLNKYLSVSPLPVFAVRHQKKVGFLKFDPLSSQTENKNGVSISINVAPENRSSGIGSSILKGANNYLTALGIKFISAEIRKENQASARAFEKAGYEFQKEAIVFIQDTGEEALVYKYLKKLG